MIIMCKIIYLALIYAINKVGESPQKELDWLA